MRSISCFGSISIAGPALSPGIFKIPGLGWLSPHPHPTPPPCPTEFSVLWPLGPAWKLPRSVGFKRATAAAVGTRTSSQPPSCEGRARVAPGSKKNQEPCLYLSVNALYPVLASTSCVVGPPPWPQFPRPFNRRTPGISLGAEKGVRCFQRRPSSHRTPPGRRSPGGPSQATGRAAVRRCHCHSQGRRQGRSPRPPPGLGRRCRGLANRRPPPGEPRTRAQRCPHWGPGGGGGGFMRHTCGDAIAGQVSRRHGAGGLQGALPVALRLQDREVRHRQEQEGGPALPAAAGHHPDLPGGVSSPGLGEGEGPAGAAAAASGGWELVWGRGGCPVTGLWDPARGGGPSCTVGLKGGG